MFIEICLTVAQWIGSENGALRRGGQVVRQGPAKPLFAGSNPARAFYFSFPEGNSWDTIECV